LILELAAGDLEGVDQPGKDDSCRALDVVVVAGHLVAVASQQGNGIDAGPVLEMNATVREDFLHRLHELVHESVQLLGTGTMPPQADVERIAQIGFVVGAGIQVHRQETFRRHTRRRRVELQLSDWNAHAVGAQVAQAEDAAGVGHADEPHLLDWPVAQHLPDVPLTSDRQIHPVRAAQDVVELQAGFADRRVVHDIEEAGRVRHQGAIEQHLVRVEQIHQVDEPFEVCGFFLELQQDPGQLGFHRLRHVGMSAHVLALTSSASRRAFTAGCNRSFTPRAAATFIAVGNESLDDCDIFTWSLG